MFLRGSSILTIRSCSSFGLDFGILYSLTVYHSLAAIKLQDPNQQGITIQSGDMNIYAYSFITLILSVSSGMSSRWTPNFYLLP